jgi:hypothetical protein
MFWHAAVKRFAIPKRTDTAPASFHSITFQYNLHNIIWKNAEKLLITFLYRRVGECLPACVQEMSSKFFAHVSNQVYHIPSKEFKTDFVLCSMLFSRAAHPNLSDT